MVLAGLDGAGGFGGFGGSDSFRFAAAACAAVTDDGYVCDALAILFLAADNFSRCLC
jgi:hypothetical protein